MNLQNLFLSDQNSRIATSHHAFSTMKITPVSCEAFIDFCHKYDENHSAFCKLLGLHRFLPKSAARMQSKTHLAFQCLSLGEQARGKMFASALASRALASLALLCGAHAFLSAPAAGRVGSRLGACTHGRREWVVVCGARRRGGAAATAAPRACAGAGGMEGLRVFGMDDVSLDRYVGQVTYTESVSVGQGPSLGAPRGRPHCDSWHGHGALISGVPDRHLCAHAR